MTHFVDISNKNLLLLANVYLTIGFDFLIGDEVIVQDKPERKEDTYTVTAIVEDAPLCKKGTNVVILEKKVEATQRN